VLRPRNELLNGRTQQRRLGAYYTSADAAGAMARWVLAGGARTALEPSFGDGAFLRALAEGGDARVYGAELNRAAFAAAIAGGHIKENDAFGDDFLAWSPPTVDAVIGNPPYVRLRHLPAEQQERAVAVAAAALPEGMQSSGSVWMAFVLHAASALRVGGRMALVLPFELTHVRYARPLWRWLGSAFGALHLMRVRERLFPELLQDVVVLFAADRGGSTATVGFEALDTVAAFVRATPNVATVTPAGLSDSAWARVSIEALLAGERGFMQALLPVPVQDALASVASLTVPVRDLCTFHIGYVSADKAFFHPDTATVARFSLPPASLLPTITSSRQVQRLWTSAIASERQLFLPGDALSARLSPADAAYVAHGESLGVHQRYKCRNREPWFCVPDVRVPDVVLSVFSERPVLAINDAGYVATNSLLCGFLTGGASTAFAAAWYTSLTLLGLELQVHALGGGVMVVVPGEASRVRVARVAAVPDGHIERLTAALAAGDVAGAYALGDDAILRRVLGVSDETVAALQEGVRVLSRWRGRRESAGAGATE